MKLSLLVFMIFLVLYLLLGGVLTGGSSIIPVELLFLGMIVSGLMVVVGVVL